MSVPGCPRYLRPSATDDSIQHATHAPTPSKILITSAQLKSDTDKIWQVAGLLSADIGWRKAGQSLPLLQTLAHLCFTARLWLLSTFSVYSPSVGSGEDRKTWKTLWYKRLKYKSSLSVMAAGGGSATLALNSAATKLYKAVFAVNPCAISSCASSWHKSNSAKTESLYKTTRHQIQRSKTGPQQLTGHHHSALFAAEAIQPRWCSATYAKQFGFANNCYCNMLS